jgi:hypothetical protein
LFESHQALIGDDYQIGIVDDAAFIVEFAGAHVGEDWGAAPFGAITRRILNLIASEEKSCAEDAAGGRPSSPGRHAVKAYAIHVILRRFSVTPSLKH